ASTADRVTAARSLWTPPRRQEVGTRQEFVTLDANRLRLQGKIERLLHAHVASHLPVRACRWAERITGWLQERRQKLIPAGCWAIAGSLVHRSARAAQAKRALHLPFHCPNAGH